MSGSTGGVRVEASAVLARSAKAAAAETVYRMVCKANEFLRA